MSGWWVLEVYDDGNGLVMLVSWIFWVIFSITLHELSHGWAAIWQGDRTPVETGHMTANPIVHIGPISLLMFAIIGIAWGLMPVNPARFRNRRYGDVLVSLAGPAMNIVLALVSLTALALWERFGTAAEPLAGNVTTFLFLGGMLNLVLALLNMLPVPPLDGSHVLAGLWLPARRFYAHENAQLFALALLFVLFVTPVGDALFGLCAEAANLYVNMLT